MQGDTHPKTPDDPAGSHARARRLANPPGSLRSPVPPKGRTKKRLPTPVLLVPLSRGTAEEHSDDAGGYPSEDP